MTAFNKDNKIKNIIMYAVIFLLSVLSGILFYQYRRDTNEQIMKENRRQAVRTEAQRLLQNTPHINYFDPGANEGVVYGVMAIIESNKDLILDDTYESYKKNVLQVIENCNENPDMQYRREQMEIAGNAALQFLQILAE